MTPEQQKAMALAAARRRRAEAEGLQPSTAAQPQPELPYYRASDFAGQSYFDERRKELEGKLRDLTKEHREWMGLPLPPIAPSQLPWSKEEKQFQQQSGDVRSQIQKLGAEEKDWAKGFPEELKNLPELTAQLRQGGERASGALIAGLLAPEDKDRLAILKNFGWKVETVNGFPKITDPESGEEYSLNKPGLSQRDLIDFFAKAEQFAPAAKITGKVGNIAGKIVTGATTSALTELAAQGIEKALGGEINGAPVALAGLFGGATEAALPVLGKLWGKLSQAGREKLLQARSIEDVQSLGVASGKELDELRNLIGPEKVAEAPPLNRPQATGAPADKGKLLAASKDPKLAEDMAKANAKRDVWAKSKLDELAAGEPLDNALKDARDASEEIFDQMYARRKREADRLYGKAFENAKDVDVSGLRGHVKTIIEDKSITGGEKARILGIVEKFLDTAKKEPENPLVRRIFQKKGEAKGDMLPAKLAQELKFEIDNLIGKRGMTAVGQNTEAALLEVQSQLKNLIEEAAPGYKAANQAFRNRTEAIDAMQEDLIGLISRKTDSNIETIGRMLDSKDIPRLLAVKGMLDQVHPKIWANVHRNWLASKIGKLPSNLMDKPNPAKTMYDTVFGKEDLSKRMIELAPDRNVTANLKWLKGYLLKSQNVREFDPAAAAQELAQEQAKGGVRSTVSKIAHSTRQSIAEGILGNGEKKRLKAIFDAMEGPEWAKRMEEVRAEGLSAEAARRFNALVDDVLRTSTQATRSESTQDSNQGIMGKTLNIK